MQKAREIKITSACADFSIVYGKFVVEFITLAVADTIKEGIKPIN